eukprot:1587277-Pleurochrysis_carterae.AAC.1
MPAELQITVKTKMSIRRYEGVGPHTVYANMGMCGYVGTRGVAHLSTDDGHLVADCGCGVAVPAG